MSLILRTDIEKLVSALLDTLNAGKQEGEKWAMSSADGSYSTSFYKDQQNVQLKGQTANVHEDTNLKLELRFVIPRSKDVKQ